jgi:hypothetical protein
MDSVLALIERDYGRLAAFGVALEFEFQDFSKLGEGKRLYVKSKRQLPGIGPSADRQLLGRAMTDAVGQAASNEPLPAQLRT